MSTYFKSGAWNCICQVCGFQFKSDEIKKRWDGLLVCAADYETRHPQDLIRTRSESSSVPFTSNETTTFIGLNYTPSIDEATTIDDLLSYSFTAFRKIPDPESARENLGDSFTFNLTPLNSTSLGGGRLNPNPEEAVLTDTLSASFTTSLADSVTLSESVTGISGKGINDSSSVTDTITYKLTTASALDAATFNGMVL